ncbi:DUF1240 domain-containing protein [Xenorhabdus sp. BG5]|nr:DUF1240 domain-containing protein [Xenorhabdus sp. BG5]
MLNIRKHVDDDIVSIIKVRGEIISYWKFIAILFMLPLFIYMFSCDFYYSVTSKTMKLNNELVKILTIIFLF